MKTNLVKILNLVSTIASVTALSIPFLMMPRVAHSAYLPGWERPIKKAEMNVTHSKLEFTSAKAVTLTLTHQDGLPGRAPTGIIVEIRNEQDQITRDLLKIQQTKSDGCGSIEYIANLAQTDALGLSGSEMSGPQFSVRLIDHTNRRCGGVPAEAQGKNWQALIRQGFGYSGAMGDSSLTVVGNPEEMITIEVQN